MKDESQKMPKTIAEAVEAKKEAELEAERLATKDSEEKARLLKEIADMLPDFRQEVKDARQHLARLFAIDLALKVFEQQELQTDGVRELRDQIAEVLNEYVEDEAAAGTENGSTVHMCVQGGDADFLDKLLAGVFANGGFVAMEGPVKLGQ